MVMKRMNVCMLLYLTLPTVTQIEENMLKQCASLCMAEKMSCFWRDRDTNQDFHSFLFHSILGRV